MFQVWLITSHSSLLTSEALLRALASSAPCGGPFRSVRVACERRARHFWIALQRYNIFRNIPNFCHRFDVILTSKLLKFGRIDASIILHSHNRNIEGDFQHEFSRFLTSQARTNVQLVLKRLTPAVTMWLRDIVTLRSFRPWTCSHSAEFRLVWLCSHSIATLSRWRCAKVSY